MRRKKQIQEKRMLQGSMQGVITIEMSYILPMVLLLLALIMYTVFYFHDKNILAGAAMETAVVGAQMERKPDEKGKTNLEAFYKQRITGKLILFPEPAAEVHVTEKQVSVTVHADRGKMKLEVRQQAPILNPEKQIRKKRLLENIAEGGKNDENSHSNGTGTQSGEAMASYLYGGSISGGLSDTDAAEK